MLIILLEPFFGGSHQQWAQDFQKHSRHEIKILSLPARFWKWRMYGGAVELALQFNELEVSPDLILASDMLDVGTFLALSREKTAKIPIVVYFHENQITYPWSPQDQDVQLKRDNQYGFINYTSALAADKILFNSKFHFHSFTNALEAFLKQFPDFQGTKNISKIREKSQVLHLGLDLKRLDHKNEIPPNPEPVILWNHRWEYDKNPDLFFTNLFRLKKEGIAFKLIVAGASYSKKPAIFEHAKAQLKEEIIHFGYIEDPKHYINFLWQADILPVTSNQEFFGASVIEAMYCQTYPLLPNRLAYPEHVPDLEKSHYFYQQDEELYLLLKKVVLNTEYAKEKALQARSFVEHYDWKHQLSQYDDIMETIK